LSSRETKKRAESKIEISSEYHGIGSASNLVMLQRLTMQPLTSNLRCRLSLALGMILLVAGSRAPGQPLFVEAESFKAHGGVMGSPDLLTHGLGRPVEDATTSARFPEAGQDRVRVRTKDWVARWGAEGQPGRFQLLVEGKPLETTFGTPHSRPGTGLRRTKTPSCPAETSPAPAPTGRG